MMKKQKLQQAVPRDSCPQTPSKWRFPSCTLIQLFSKTTAMLSHCNLSTEAYFKCACSFPSWQTPCKSSPGIIPLSVMSFALHCKCCPSHQPSWLQILCLRRNILKFIYTVTSDLIFFFWTRSAPRTLQPQLLHWITTTLNTLFNIPGKLLGLCCYYLQVLNR